MDLRVQMVVQIVTGIWEKILVLCAWGFFKVGRGAGGAFKWCIKFASSVVSRARGVRGALKIPAAAWKHLARHSARTRRHGNRRGKERKREKIKSTWI